VKLEVITIVHNGMPWIAHHFPILNSLTDVDWRWHVCEGAADNIKDTKWCKKPTQGISTDGTAQFLDSIARSPRVKLYRKSLWQGKVDMVNAPIPSMQSDAVVLQVDCDEFWTADQIRGILKIFEENQEIGYARFFCNYFLGPNIITTGESSYGNKSNEWLRAWRYKPGMKWITHEPPNLGGNQGREMTRFETRERGLVFNHYAYVLDSQIAQKEKYYGYENLALQWKILQMTRQWPVKLKSFLRWTDEAASARNLYR
jgi:glycosyl transferase family 2